MSMKKKVAPCNETDRPSADCSLAGLADGQIWFWQDFNEKHHASYESMDLKGRSAEQSGVTASRIKLRAIHGGLERLSTLK